jgi:hypothetical protein
VTSHLCLKPLSAIVNSLASLLERLKGTSG